MRNIRIFLIFLFIFNLSLSAQNIRFAVFANPTINWFKSDVKSAKNESAIIGYDIGFSMDRYFAEHYAFNSGASITSMGGSLKYNYDYVYSTRDSAVNIPANTTVKIRLQYITIPIGLKFTSKEIGYTTIYANLGFSTHFNISATGNSEDKNASLDHDNITKEIRFFNLAYYFGGGIQYSLGGNTAILFGINYSNGIVDVTKEKRDKISSNCFSFKIGLQF
jgi:hypothetical protein